MADGNLTKIEERADAVSPMREPADLMGALVLAAINPDIDADKMERMLAMYERMEDRKAEIAFNQAFVAAKSAVRPLVRNKSNDQTSSRYVDLMRIADVIDPIMAEHGFAPTFGTEPSDRDGHYRMVCDLLHKDGHSKRYAADIPVDASGIKGTRNKTDTHAFGSSTTYGRRYLKLMIFDIATKDDDGNGAGGEPVETLGPEEMTVLDDLLKRTRVDRKVFFGYAKVEGMADIQMKNFEKLKASLEAKLEHPK